MQFQKSILTILIIVSSFHLSFSQISIGIQQGISLFRGLEDGDPLTNDFDDLKQLNSIGNYTAMYAKLNLKNNWFLQPEISFLQKGHKRSFNTLMNNQTINFELDNRYNYIEIPLLGKYVFKFQKHGIELGMGPSIGFLFGKRKDVLKFEDTKSVNRFEYDIIFTDMNGEEVQSSINKFDLSAVADIAYQYQLGFGKIRTGLRHYWDFTDSFSQIKNDLEDNSDLITNSLTNYGFTFYVGYEIKL